MQTSSCIVEIEIFFAWSCEIWPVTEVGFCSVGSPDAYLGEKFKPLSNIWFKWIVLNSWKIWTAGKSSGFYWGWWSCCVVCHEGCVLHACALVLCVYSDCRIATRQSPRPGADPTRNPEPNPDSHVQEKRPGPFHPQRADRENQMVTEGLTAPSPTWIWSFRALNLKKISLVRGPEPAPAPPRLHHCTEQNSVYVLNRHRGYSDY